MLDTTDLSDPSYPLGQGGSAIGLMEAGYPDDLGKNAGLGECRQRCNASQTNGIKRWRQSLRNVANSFANVPCWRLKYFKMDFKLGLFCM